MAIDNLNMIKIVEERLKIEIKSAITESLVRDELKEFELKLREKIKPLVEKLIVTGVSKQQDMIKMREELYVYIKWNTDA